MSMKDIDKRSIVVQEILRTAQLCRVKRELKLVARRLASCSEDRPWVLAHLATIKTESAEQMRR